MKLESLEISESDSHKIHHLKNLKHVYEYYSIFLARLASRLTIKLISPTRTVMQLSTLNTTTDRYVLVGLVGRTVVVTAFYSSSS